MKTFLDTIFKSETNSDPRVLSLKVLVPSDKFSCLNTNPTANVEIEINASNPHTIIVFSPKSLKNEDTITPVKTYFDMSIK